MTTHRLSLPASTRSGVKRTLAYGLLILAVFLAITPILWMILSSFKELEDMFTVPMTWLPDPWNWHSYADAWAQRDFTRYFLNSFLIAISITAITAAAGQ